MLKRTALTDKELKLLMAIDAAAEPLEHLLNNTLVPSRETSLAKTNFQQTLMWARASITEPSGH